MKVWVLFMCGIGWSEMIEIYKKEEPAKKELARLEKVGGHSYEVDDVEVIED